MTDPATISIELVGNTDKLDRTAKVSADRFERNMDRIEGSAAKAERSIESFGKSAESSIPASGGEAAKGLQKIGSEAAKAEGEFKQYQDRLERVANAARRAFARIPEVRLARQLDPSGFEPAREEFARRIVEQEKLNITQGIGESTEALDSLFTSSSKAGAGLAKVAGFAAAAGAAITILAKGVVASLQAFDSAERDVERFNATVALAGNRSLASAESIRSIADAISDVTLQTEASTRTAAAELATVPGLAANALEEALSVSARLADALEQDVTDVVSGTVAPALQALANDDIAALDEALLDLDPIIANTVVQLAEAGRTADAQKALFNGLANAAGNGPNSLATAADQLNERWIAAKKELGEDIASVTVPILEGIISVIDDVSFAAKMLRFEWSDLAAFLASPITATINIVRRAEQDTIAAAQQEARNRQFGDFAGRFLARQEAAARARAEEERQERIESRNTPSRGGGRSGPSAAQLAEQEARRARQAAAEQERLDQEILRTRGRLARTEQERLDLALQSIDLQRRLDLEDVDRRVAAEELTQAEAQAIRDRIETQAQLQRTLLDRQEAERAALRDLQEFRQRERQAILDFEVGSAQRDGQALLLQGAAALARTQADRRDIELELLDLQFEEERLRNDAIIAEFNRARIRSDITDAELAELEAAAAIAQLRNEQLGALRGQATEGILVSTAGPLEGFFRDLPQGARELNEALENVAANGLASVVDGLTDAVVNFESLEQVALQTLRSITQQLVRLAIQAILVRALGIPGFSGGGTVGGPAPGFAGGGLIRGPGTGTSDSILASSTQGPIRVSDGEYILRASAVDAIGVRTLDAINRSGRLPGLRNGGAVRAIASGGAGMSRGDMDRLAQIVAEAAAAQPEVNLYPTLDPGSALRASLNSRGGQQAIFDFLQANSERVGASINR